MPSGDRFLVKTAKIRRGGEPLCLQLGKRRVSVAACDADKRHQQFSFRTTRNRYLVQNDLGGFEAAAIGEGTPDIDTPFLVLDKGRANLPALD
ncbi:hypothetical protein [Nocardioides hwasunensis]|uniref:Ricin B lectin domain-containing protein n=1 Tax=Nocardioides hwasunensis TaxID=397258 RepID=A0ABR8MEG4_9ACTN|nr:hypothetical protein [Nocardioides hwasunensis]MBD3914268.1 hypothetical protein [Nocardioides hwasunensis]